MSSARSPGAPCPTRKCSARCTCLRSKLCPPSPAAPYRRDNSRSSGREATRAMMPSVRVNYDLIAHLFDKGPYRAKSVDPELLAFMAHRTVSDLLSILDIGCGTGNQLVANGTIVPHSRLV